MLVPKSLLMEISVSHYERLFQHRSNIRDAQDLRFNVEVRSQTEHCGFRRPPSEAATV